MITLSIMAGVSVFPFSIMRILNGNIVHAVIDFSLSCMFFAISAYVYKTKKTHYPGILLTFICMGGLSILLNIHGPSFVYWAYPIVICSYYISSPRVSFILNFTLIASVIPAFLITLQSIEMATVLLTLVLTNIFSYIFSLKHREQRRELRHLALFDALTGVRNRRALDQRLEQCMEEETQYCLMILDIDHFKKLNDEFGHKVGDELLTTIAEIISNRIRTTDTLYRYGGEEFVIVAPDISIEHCVNLAEELRELVMAHKFTQDISMTISIGVSELKKGESAHEWVLRSDKALYKAKDSGRNQTVTAGKELKI